MATTAKIVAEMAEIKNSLNFMSREISEVVEQQRKLTGLMEEIRQLKIIIQQKDERIDLLEQRVDDLEQYSRADDLVITGLETRHQSYARATGLSGYQQGEDAPSEELETLEQQVVRFMKSKIIPLDKQQISACYILPSKDKKNKPKIIVKIASRRHKVEILKEAKKLKGTGVYINEHLTKKNAEIAWTSRTLKKENKIQSTWTRNGKVFIRTNGPPEQVKVIVVRKMKDLDLYK